MTDINVDDFFNDVARALLALFKVFPRRKALFVEDICGPEEPDEFGMFSDRYLSCLGALLWLGEEGFLRFEDTINLEAIDQAVLTGRCFTLLSTPGVSSMANSDTLPESVKLERSTRVFRLEQAVRGRSSSEVRASVLDLLSQMFGLDQPELPITSRNSGSG